MKNRTLRTDISIGRYAGVAALALALTGCSAADRLANIGEKPLMSPIVNPTSIPGYQPVSMPMPNPQVVERQPNSLWRGGSRTFFKDLRASRVGDILTVVIDLNEVGTFTADDRRRRDNTEASNIASLFGFQRTLAGLLPKGIGGRPDNSSTAGGDNGIGAGYTSSNDIRGRGDITRTERLSMRLAATVTQILPNGNLVISGKQEIRVNFELRELVMVGIVRPEDISARNTVNYDQIAEARVSYGGRGQMTDVQQPRYGTQLLDIISPF
ncbi:MAG: flagellar basal body L-ring protein FlgH [Elsteraceae bacterium]